MPQGALRIEEQTAPMIHFEQAPQPTQATLAREWLTLPPAALNAVVSTFVCEISGEGLETPKA